MDEQRIAAYLDLIQQLLTCPDGDEGRILNENRELVNGEFLQVCETIAQQMEQGGRENEARKLRQLVRVLRGNGERATEQEYGQFLMAVLQAAWESGGDPNVVYPLLQQNLDKLDLTLAQILRAWASQTLEQVEAEQRQGIAADICDLGNLIQQFPLGSRADNLEIAIICYEIAFTVFTQATNPPMWATLQNQLGNAYRNRIRGERAENLEEAIAAYSQALQVLTREAFPQDWAMTQNNLGAAYWERIRGERAENLEEAIGAFSLALQVRTREAFPQEWAATQHNLGTAYSDRIRGERAENLEEAIGAYSQALQVTTREAFPQDWAMTQNNLATAYCERIRGERAENLEKAIDVFSLALQVYTRDAFPQQWATTQNNLGAAYRNRIRGERAENLEEAIAAFSLALQVLTRDAFPQDWAMTQNNLASAYSNRIRGERAENLEEAIAAYSQALQVYTRDAFPQNHTGTLFNLGLAYRKARQLENAYTTFAQAIDTVEEIRRGIILGGDADKQKLAEEWQKLYREMIEVCLELEDDSGALEYAERSKARNLVELLAATRLRPEAIPPDLWERYRDLYQQWWQVQQQQGGDSDSRPTPGDSRSAPVGGGSGVPAATVRTLRQQLDQLIAEDITPHDPKFGYGQQVTPITYGEIQGLVNPHTVLVEWYFTTKGVHSFIVTHQGTQPQVLTTDPQALERLEELTDLYLSSYQQDNLTPWQTQLPTYLAALAEILELDTLVAALPDSCQQLILVPYRFLHLFPLHALPLEGGILADRFPQGIRYAPSSQILQLSVSQDAPVSGEALFAVQNPTADLEYTDLEVEAIQQSFSAPPTILQGEQATKTEFNERLSQLTTTDFAHFACHGYFNFVHPQSSGLILAGSQMGETGDRRTPAIRSRRGTFEPDKCLILPEIFNLRLPHCRLVVLSACETAISDITATSDEYISILAGFFFAGSRHVLGTLWAVNDVSTALFMIYFYERLFTEPRPSVTLALKQTQEWMRQVTVGELLTWLNKCRLMSEPGKKRVMARFARGYKPEYTPYDEPYYWAGFCVVGV
jgi:CHAT domain-containing protein/tetratricopeptide (TPR) repeat protein